MPDRLEGRVSAIVFLLAVGSIPGASVVVDALLDAAGATLTFALLGR